MNKYFDKFAFTNKVILYISPLLGIIGITIPLLIGQNNLSLLGSYLAIPMIFAPIIYILHQNKDLINLTVTYRLLYILKISYYFCLSISIMVLYFYNYRTNFYYFLVTIMSLIILLKILYVPSEKEVKIILFETMVLSLNVLWGVTLKYYYYFGLTDVFAHSWFIDNLITQGFVTETFNIYKPFPLWHILCVFVHNITGSFFSPPKIMFFINGIIFSFIVPIMYLLSLKLLANKKMALLVALFTVFYPPFIVYGMYSISRSVIIFLEIIFIMLLLDYNNREKKILSGVIVYSIVLYHTVSIVFIFTILITCFIVYQAYISHRDSKFISTTYLTIIFTLTLVYWMYYAEALFESLVNYIALPTPNIIITNVHMYTSIYELFNNIHYSFILFFLILGSLWATKSNEISFIGRIFCILGLVFAALSFPGPALLLEKLSVNFNIIRFSQYSIVFIVVPMSVGFFKLYCKTKEKYKFYVIVAFILMVFLSISNDYTASDNPLVEKPFFTFYLTKEETVAVNHISMVSNGYVMSDDIIERYLFSSRYNDKSHVIEINPQNMTFLRYNGSDILLIRKNELGKRPLRLYSSKSGNFEMSPSRRNLDYYFNDLSLWNELKNYNRIYNSGGVIAVN